MRKNGLGGAIVSRNIYEGTALTKWCYREEPVNPADNGWRFLSEIDTDEYLEDPNNSLVVAWETILDREPAIMPIIDMPIGTEITIVRNQEGKFALIDSMTGERMKFGDDSFSRY